MHKLDEIKDSFDRIAARGYAHGYASAVAHLSAIARDDFARTKDEQRYLVMQALVLELRKRYLALRKD